MLCPNNLLTWNTSKQYIRGSKMITWKLQKKYPNLYLVSLPAGQTPSNKGAAA